MLRVAYLGSSASPHNRRWVSYLATEFELRVFSLEPEDIPGVTVHHTPRRTGTALDYLLARRTVARAVADFEPDLIHAHRITSYGYLGAAAAERARRRNGETRFILSVWGEDVFSFPRRSPLHRAFTSRVLAGATQILSTSRVMRDETLRYVTPGRPIYVTPFGVDLSRFHSSGARAGGSTDAGHAEAGGAGTGQARGARAEHAGHVGAAPSGPVRMITVKKLRPRYGVDVLLRAFAQARQRLAGAPELTLEVVGEGPQRAELETLCGALGIQDSVTFRGRVPHDQVPELLDRADIFAALSVSDDESFGVAMVEASATELPVVSTTVGGIPEVVLHGRTGLLVPPHDAATAAEAIEKLAVNPAMRSQMGAAGRAYVEREYDWSVTAARMARIYREVAGRG